MVLSSGRTCQWRLSCRLWGPASPSAERLGHPSQRPCELGSLRCRCRVHPPLKAARAFHPSQLSRAEKHTDSTRSRPGVTSLGSWWPLFHQVLFLSTPQTKGSESNGMVRGREKPSVPWVVAKGRTDRWCLGTPRRARVLCSMTCRVQPAGRAERGSPPPIPPHTHTHTNHRTDRLVPVGGKKHLRERGGDE